MLNKEIYIRRLCQCRHVPHDREALERLSVEELSALWSRVVRAALEQTRRSA